MLYELVPLLIRHFYTPGGYVLTSVSSSSISTSALQLSSLDLPRLSSGVSEWTVLLGGRQSARQWRVASQQGSQF